MTLGMCFSSWAHGAIVETQARMCMHTHTRGHIHAHTCRARINCTIQLLLANQHLVALSGALWKRFHPFFIKTTLILDCGEMMRGNYFCFLQQDAFKRMSSIPRPEALKEPD